MKIRIEQLFDETDCETCGVSYATGFIVYLDDEKFLEFLPLAACYDGDSFELDYVYGQILAKLGYDVELLDP